MSSWCPRPLCCSLGWGGSSSGPVALTAAQLEGGVQRVEVSVRSGYSPDLIRVRQGVPVDLVFDRQESGDCTSRVVLADLLVSAALPAYERTTVRIDPDTPGSFGSRVGSTRTTALWSWTPLRTPRPLGPRPPVSRSRHSVPTRHPG